MSVPVSVPPDQGYELTRSSLEKMWKKYAEDKSYKDVFKVRQNVVQIKGKRGHQFLFQISRIYACKNTNTTVDT